MLRRTALLSAVRSVNALGILIGLGLWEEGRGKHEVTLRCLIQEAFRAMVPPHHQDPKWFVLPPQTVGQCDFFFTVLVNFFTAE